MKSEDTPRTKTKKLMQKASTKSVRKVLDFHHVLVESMKRQRENIKKSLRMILAHQILKKYKFKTYAIQQTGLNPIWKLFKKSLIPRRCSKRVQEFFERDDVSRLLTGQKKTVTKKKQKKQKRLLCNSLKHLHLKCQTETKTNIQNLFNILQFETILGCSNNRKRQRYMSLQNL